MIVSIHSSKIYPLIPSFSLISTVVITILMIILSMAMTLIGGTDHRFEIIAIRSLCDVIH